MARFGMGGAGVDPYMSAYGYGEAPSGLVPAEEIAGRARELSQSPYVAQRTDITALPPATTAETGLQMAQRATAQSVLGAVQDYSTLLQNYGIPYEEAVASAQGQYLPQLQALANTQSLLTMGQYSQAYNTMSQQPLYQQALMKEMGFVGGTYAGPEGPRSYGFAPGREQPTAAAPAIPTYEELMQKAANIQQMGQGITVSPVANQELRQLLDENSIRIASGEATPSPEFQALLQNLGTTTMEMAASQLGPTYERMMRDLVANAASRGVTQSTIVSRGIEDIGQYLASELGDVQRAVSAQTYQAMMQYPFQVAELRPQETALQQWEQELAARYGLAGQQMALQGGVQLAGLGLSEQQLAFQREQAQEQIAVQREQLEQAAKENQRRMLMYGAMMQPNIPSVQMPNPMALQQYGALAGPMAGGQNLLGGYYGALRMAQPYQWGTSYTPPTLGEQSQMMMGEAMLGGWQPGQAAPMYGGYPVPPDAANFGLDLASWGYM